MNAQAAIQRMLQSRFAASKAKNPTYSLRAFSRKLGLSSGAVSTILNGKRRVSPKLARRIADSLGLDPQERAELLDKFRPQEDDTPTRGADSYLQISADQFRLISEWHHFAILSLLRTRGFRNDPQWIARRLGISAKTSKAALDRLSRIGMIRVDKHGKISRSAPKYRTSDDVASLSLRQAHAQNFELAKASLERDAIGRRDFTAITMAIDPEKLPLAKERVRKFQDDLSELLETAPSTEVYKLCVQLFPLSLPERPERKENSR